MKNLKKQIFSVLFIFVLQMFFISGCATIPKKEFTPANTDSSQKRVCILYHASKFRNEVIYNLTKKLNENNIHVTIDDVVKFKEHSPKKYDLVIVFSGMHAFIPDAYPRNYLWKNKNSKNILHVFCTFFTRKGVTIRSNTTNGIDTISAASIKKNNNELLNIVFDMVIKKLSLN